MFTRTLHNVSETGPRLVGQPPWLPSSSEAGGASPPQGGTASSVEPVTKIYDPNKKVEVVVYNMERFAKDCVNVFCELSGYSKDKVGTAPTPLLDEANDPLLVLEEPVSSPPQGGTAGKGKNTLPPQGGAVNAVGTGSGKLSEIAYKVLMKIMYIARFARPDLLRAVGAFPI